MRPRWLILRPPRIRTSGVKDCLQRMGSPGWWTKLISKAASSSWGWVKKAKPVLGVLGQHFSLPPQGFWKPASLNWHSYFTYYPSSLHTVLGHSLHVTLSTSCPNKAKWDELGLWFTKKHCIAEGGRFQPPNNEDFPTPQRGSAARCVLVSHDQRGRHHLVWTWLLKSQPYACG